MIQSAVRKTGVISKHCLKTDDLTPGRQKNNWRY